MTAAPGRRGLSWAEAKQRGQGWFPGHDLQGDSLQLPRAAGQGTCMGLGTPSQVKMSLVQGVQVYFVTLLLLCCVLVRGRVLYQRGKGI